MAARPRARSNRSESSHPARPQQELAEKNSFDPCAATATHFLYAQQNIVVVLHHDTLAVERKFDVHRHEVLLIAADNVSERGGGRQIASYDAGQNAVVWDLFTGSVIARFSSYENIRAAAWMRDGSVVFGNEQGNIILFEPSSEEHLSTRTIYDPITALAPSSDCRTYAIGYQNGSILVATLHPQFTIHHTLNTSRVPSPISGLSWHGSSSKQKTDMLATQTADGDLRVWSVAKAPNTDPPRVIRVIGGELDINRSSKSWFSWSKNGRIISHAEGITQAWDVRTKKMTHDPVPTISNVSAIANYGPNAVLFTVGLNHTVQQYDLSAQEGPIMVANVQHVPPNAPPTPPDSIEEHKLSRGMPTQMISVERPLATPSVNYETSEDEGSVLSPLEKISLEGIAKEMDELEDERRDQLAPLSPISSRASMSSASSYGGKSRRRRGASQSQKSNVSGEETIFSGASSILSGHDNVSLNSGVSGAQSGQQSSSARKSTMRSPEESNNMKTMDLFPFTKARLSEVKFRTPQYPQAEITADVLRREMLSVVFGWDHDIESLIRDEQNRHKAGSAAGVLLSKWLGDSGADSMASMIASESMTSTDWMLLALTANMGNGPQKQMGEAFVKRSLEANEIHPAVAILLGLGSQNEAVEVYVSRKYYLEAVLLVCLVFPHDWQRQSHLVRKWGEWAVGHNNAELAVRCFSCTSIEPSEPWFSPRSQDMVYQAQQRALAPDAISPAMSPPSAGSNRVKNASLKLITSFGDKGLPKPQETTNVENTPIIDTAMTPGPGWRRPDIRNTRDQSETRTATPGGYKRHRLPSSTRHAENDAASNTTDSRRPRRQATPALSDIEDPTTVIDKAHPVKSLPSPHPAAFASDRARARAPSRDRNYQNLHLDMPSGDSEEDRPSDVGGSLAPRTRHARSVSGVSRTSKLSAPPMEVDPISPALTTGNSVRSFKGRNIDRYIDSLEEANMQAQQQQSEYRMRAESRDGRSRSRARATGASQIQGGKRSPSSPKSMTTEDANMYAATQDPEPAGPIVRPATADPSMSRRARSSSRHVPTRHREESPDARTAAKPASRSTSKQRQGHSRNITSEGDEYANTERKSYHSGRLSPPSPAPMESDPVPRPRQRSSSRRAPDARARSVSRLTRDPIVEEYVDEHSSELPSEFIIESRPQGLSRKAMAAKELEDRRLSLARRTPIPQPGELSGKSALSPLSANDSELLSAKSYNKTSGTSTSSVPIGLPATPRAMRHPRYMGSETEERETIPAVPALPGNLETLAPIAYQLPGSKDTDSLGPLLPSTVYSGQRPVLARSASAPPEKFMGGAKNSTKGQYHTRHISERNLTKPLQAAETRSLSQVAEDQVIIVGDETNDEPRPIMAELAHLAGPPPPPPPPAMYSNSVPQPPPSGVINIAIDDGNVATSPTNPGSPPIDDPMMLPQHIITTTRSRQNSFEASKGLNNSSSKWRQVAERMRSGSRSRNSNKSPNPEVQYASLNNETMASKSYGRSPKTSPPYETNLDGGSYFDQLPSPPPPPLPPVSQTSPTSVYRSPKEVRANLSPLGENHVMI